MPKTHEDKVSFGKMRSTFFFGLIGILAIALLYIFRPFFYPIFWAAIIAVMFYPLYKKLLKWTKSKNLSTTLVMIIVVLVIFIPLAVISSLIVSESLKLVSSVSQSSLFTANTVDSLTDRLSGTKLEPYVESVKTEWITYANMLARQTGAILFSSIKSVTQNTLRFIAMLFLMFYTLFFFFRDGNRMLTRLMHLSPLGDKYEKMLYEKFTSTTRATLKSTVIVGGIQGIIGGLLFWFVGVEGAIVWGVIMTALSIIPAIGSFIIWLPVGIIMLALGNVWQGVTILLVGSLIIGTIDNFIRPPLIGKDIQMHPLVVLFSTLGGLVIFGISGFVIGPIIAALFISIISIYDHYYKNELKHN